MRAARRAATAAIMLFVLDANEIFCDGSFTGVLHDLSASRAS